MAKATDAVVRAMLKRVRKHMAEYSNCPICAEVDYDKNGKQLCDEHKHEPRCFWEKLKAMKL